MGLAHEEAVSQISLQDVTCQIRAVCTVGARWGNMTGNMRLEVAMQRNERFTFTA